MFPHARAHMFVCSAFLCFALPVFASVFSIENPIGAPDLISLIGAISKAVIQVGIPFAAIALIFGGFRFVSATATGNESKLTEARKLLWWTIVGTAVIVGGASLVYAVVNFAKTLG